MIVKMDSPVNWVDVYKGVDKMPSVLALQFVKMEHVLMLNVSEMINAMEVSAWGVDVKMDHKVEIKGEIVPLKKQ